MHEPLAYHLSWTCYGQWLHGDVRGYVDDRHRTPGEPYIYDHPQRRSAAANRMAEPPCWLTHARRGAAEEALREACAFRGWMLHALNVQPDHVHVVITARGLTGKRVMQRLKDRATRRLRETVPERRRWWTEGGKVDLIFNERHLGQVVDYVHSRQPFPRA